jgi:hypothetical protein
MVTVLPTGLEVRGFKASQERWILRVIKICTTTSFGGKVKPSAPCHKISRQVKDPLRYNIDIER